MRKQRMASVAVLHAFMLLLLAASDPESSTVAAEGDCKNTQHYICEDETCSPEKC